MCPWLQAHGVLMVVALTIFLPLSVVVAHAMRDTWGSRLWFQIHRSANVRMRMLLLSP
jgi:hypothetical protein